MATETARKRYVRHRSALWWTKNPRYLLFQFRELSGVFVAIYAFLVLYQLWSLRGGRDAYDAFLVLAYSRPFVILNAVVLGFVLLHAVTWFFLTPKAIVIRVGDRRAPTGIVVGGMFLAWAVVTFLVLTFLYGGI